MLVQQRSHSAVPRRGNFRSNGEKFIVELQKAKQNFFKDRIRQAFVNSELANLNREEQAIYQTSLKVYRDWRSVIDTIPRETKAAKKAGKKAEGQQWPKRWRGSRLPGCLKQKPAGCWESPDEKRRGKDRSTASLPKVLH